MEADYIEIAGKVYRVEVNWNVMEKICEMKGIKDITKMDSLVSFSPGELREVMMISIAEGERLQGNKLEISSEDLFSGVRMPQMMEFMSIFKKHVSPEASDSAPREPVKKKRKRRWFR